jgi:predicted aminopeptidase
VDSAAYLAYVRGLIGELETLYGAAGLSREEKLREKEAIILRSQERFEAEYESRFSRDNYRGFSTLELNNAYLELFRLYYDGSDFYAELYRRAGEDLPGFIAAAKRLNGMKIRGDPKEALETAVLAE